MSLLFSEFSSAPINCSDFPKEINEALNLFLSEGTYSIALLFFTKVSNVDPVSTSDFNLFA